MNFPQKNKFHNKQLSLSLTHSYTSHFCGGREGQTLKFSPMKVTIKVKCVNHEFDKEWADQTNEGKESADNIQYLWEDEFDVKGDVTDFKIKNNVEYHLTGILPDETSFDHHIPAMTIIECTLKDGTVSQFPISKKLIKDTEKKISKDKEQTTFFVFLRGNAKIVNPFEGGYFLKEDFPFDLPEAEAEDNDEDLDLDERAN
jgi:hypothetical protein